MTLKTFTPGEKSTVTSPSAALCAAPGEPQIRSQFAIAAAGKNRKSDVSPTSKQRQFTAELLHGAPRATLWHCQRLFRYARAFDFLFKHTMTEKSHFKYQRIARKVEVIAKLMDCQVTVMSAAPHLVITTPDGRQIGVPS